MWAFSNLVALWLIVIAAVLVLLERRRMRVWSRAAQSEELAGLAARQYRRRVAGSILMAAAGVMFFVAANFAPPEQPEVFALAWGAVAVLVTAMAALACFDLLVVRRAIGRQMKHLAEERGRTLEAILSGPRTRHSGKSGSSGGNGDGRKRPENP